MKKLIAGNWKMNGGVMDAESLMAGLDEALQDIEGIYDVADVLVCPPFVHIGAVQNEVCPVMVGAQDCSEHGNGAYTGQVSAEMLKDMGCSHVILGHSERRQLTDETDDEVSKKAAKAHEAGLVAIICVGETNEQREAGQEQAVVGAQIDGSLPSSATVENTVIAYEPVWAIGTGKTASASNVSDMHGFIRGKLQEKLADSKDMRILYGGSMKPENAADLLATPNVDGGLIGGASLKVEDFMKIIESCRN